jgi:hypothetical protein
MFRAKKYGSFKLQICSQKIRAVFVFEFAFLLRGPGDFVRFLLNANKIGKILSNFIEFGEFWVFFLCFTRKIVNFH